MSTWPCKKSIRALVAASSALLAFGVAAGSAEASGRPSFDDARVSIRGGDANALGSCLSDAHEEAKQRWSSRHHSGHEYGYGRRSRSGRYGRGHGYSYGYGYEYGYRSDGGYKHKKRHNPCQGIARAEGGDVYLDDVDVSVLGGGRSFDDDSAKVVLRGGDANAIAACVNYAQGTYGSDDEQKCASSAVAKGGDVIINDSNITVLDY